MDRTPLEAQSSTAPIPINPHQKTSSAHPNAPPIPIRMQGWDTDTVFTNVDPQQLKLWYSILQLKLLIYIWMSEYQLDVNETVQKRQTAIANLLSIPEPTVDPPAAANPSTCKFAAPWCFLVTGLPPTAATTLIYNQIWSTPVITFFAILFTPRPSDYICTIANLTFPESKANEVLHLIKTTVLNSKQAKICIAFDNPDPNALRYTTDSMYIHPLRIALPGSTGGGHRTIWNLYSDPPSLSLRRHQEWRQTISSLKFLTALNRVGTAEPPTSCFGCKWM
jgi:hypothetical protein